MKEQAFMQFLLSHDDVSRNKKSLQNFVIIMIRVAVFEDKPELREGLADLLTSAEDIQFCGAWENCNHVQRLMQQHQPDVVLMDIEMPGVNGLQGLQLIKKI